MRLVVQDCQESSRKDSSGILQQALVTYILVFLVLQKKLELRFLRCRFCKSASKKNRTFAFADDAKNDKHHQDVNLEKCV